jgi:hypothetical protein
MPEPERTDRRRAALIAYDVCRRALTPSDPARRAAMRPVPDAWVCFSIQSGPHPECRGTRWNCLQNRWVKGSRPAPIRTPPLDRFALRYQGPTVIFAGWAPIYTWQHPFAGTSHSRGRTHPIPATASAGEALRTSPRSGRRVRQRRPVPNHQRLSALRSWENHPPPKPLPRQVP